MKIMKQLTPLTTFEQSAVKNFKRHLEEMLDEYFPKIYEEGEKKRLNKRGEALMLFVFAVLGLEATLREHREHIRKEVENVFNTGTTFSNIATVDEYANGWSDCRNRFQKEQKRIKTLVLSVLSDKE